MNVKTKVKKIITKTKNIKNKIKKRNKIKEAE